MPFGVMQVDVLILASAAAGAVAAAGTLDDARTATRDNLALANQRGWAAAAATRAAEDAWHAHVGRLAGDMRSFGRELLAAAGLVGATDEQSGKAIGERVPR